MVGQIFLKRKNTQISLLSVLQKSKNSESGEKMAGCFALLSPEDCEVLYDLASNESMKKSINLQIVAYRQWVDVRGKNANLYGMNIDDLDRTLQHFCPELQKNDRKITSLIAWG